MKTSIIFALAVAIMATGCSFYSVGVPTDETGKAYVVKTNGARQDLYLCTATSGTPVCVQQIEQ